MKFSADVHVNTIHVTPRVQGSLIAPILEERALVKQHTSVFTNKKEKGLKKTPKEDKKNEEDSISTTI